MGSPKQNLVLDGRTFAELVVAAIAPHAHAVALLGPGEVAPALAALPRVPDLPGVAGPLAGILGAFAHRPDVAWLIAACDLPLLSPEAVAWLVSMRQTDSLALLPRLAQNGVEPLLAIYEPAAAPVLGALAAGGERSLQPFAEDARVATPQPPEELWDAWRNVNDPEDVRAAARRVHDRGLPRLLSAAMSRPPHGDC